MKKRAYKSNGIKTASAADCLEREEINQLKEYLSSLDLSKPNNLRNFTLVTFNLNVGLRAGDLLSLPKDLIIKNNTVVDSFAINEQKTGKKRIIELNNTAKKVILKPTSNDSDIVVAGIDKVKVNLANCCNPIYGDPIVGYITKGNGISVHRLHCHNLEMLENRTLDVKWNSNINKKEKLQLMNDISIMITDTANGIWKQVERDLC